MAAAEPGREKSTSTYSSVTSGSTGSKSLTIMDNGTLVIDGERVEGKRFTMIDDPFAGLEAPEPPTPPMPPMPPVPAFMSESTEDGYAYSFGSTAELTRLSLEMSRDGMKLGHLASQLALAELRGEKEQCDRIEAEMESLEDTMDQRSDRIEAAAAAHEAQIEDWEARHEAQTERFEADLEAQLEQYESQMEAQLELYEHQLENAADSASMTIDQLAGACRAAELAGGEARTLSVERGGRTWRAICEDTTVKKEG
jgi:hypothetical protein